MNDIPLKNGEVANYLSTRHTIIREINPNEPTAVHVYGVPCPLCKHRNPAYSYDGKAFVVTQINCRECGIFYRPIVDPEFLKGQVLAVNLFQKR